MEITICNCNNIDSGNIHIENGRLNIKYAINGTGKSTVARALHSKLKGENLSDLRPFKYVNDELNIHAPNVEISDPIQKIAIFDEKYIDTYAYKKEELVENSFEIFVKTPKYAVHMQEITLLISSIQAAFQDDPELDMLIRDLSVFIDSFGKTQSGYSKASEIGKTIGKGNRLENVPEDIAPYAPYLRIAGTNLNWLKWQAEGKDYLEITDKCPYCVSSITTPKSTILKVSQEYDTKYLAALCKILDTFKSLNAYFTEETRVNIDAIAKNATGITEDQIAYLKRLKEEVITLRDKLNNLKYLGFSSLKDVDHVVDALRDKMIDLAYYNHLNCDYTNVKISKVNTSLKDVVKVAGKLQGQIAQQKDEIKRTIEKNSNEINNFLKSAGYQYEVSIRQAGENYRLILSYTSQVDGITNVKEHLSYGEKNAFALVLFMYQTIKENADLIILDDPISSFDSNKKYAIMSMLFRGTPSFQGKTVLMMTHDFEPIIDVLCILPDLFTPGAKAYFVANITGTLEERPICRMDVKSCITICEDNIIESTDAIHRLIYYRRLLEMQDIKNLAWELVSNVFHKNRDIPQKKENGVMRNMTELEIEVATALIRQKIPDFDYLTIYERTKSITDMINLYHTAKSGYEKVQVYRLLFDGDMERGDAIKKYIDEAFHVQNDYLFQLNPREYKIVPQYILDYCNLGIRKLETGQ